MYLLRPLAKRGARPVRNRQHQRQGSQPVTVLPSPAFYWASLFWDRRRKYRQTLYAEVQLHADHLTVWCRHYR